MIDMTGKVVVTAGATLAVIARDKAKAQKVFGRISRDARVEVFLADLASRGDLRHGQRTGRPHPAERADTALRLRLRRHAG